MLVVFIRTLLLYGLVIFGMRIMGKRQLGELQPSELVVTILISNIATLPIENTDVPLLAGAIPILTLMCFEVIISYITLKSKALRRFVSGNPRILIKDGKIDQNEMGNIRYSIDDLMEQLHSNGIFDLREVDFAIVETTGKLSVCKKTLDQALTPKVMKIDIKNSNPPVVLISDSEIIDESMIYCNMTTAQLEKTLKKEGHSLKEIFLMTCTPDKDYYIVLQDKKSSI